MSNDNLSGAGAIVVYEGLAPEVTLPTFRPVQHV